MDNIKAVVFDLYGTLICLQGKTKVYQRLFKDIGLNTKSELKQAIKTAFTQDFNSLESLIKKIRPKSDIKTTDYEKELEKEIKSAKLYTDSIPTLSKLMEKNIKLGLISNLSSPYKKPFFSLRLEDYFDAFLLSCDIGLLKPDPAIYRKIAQNLELEPSSILMIGDSLQSDVNGPISIGMQAIHLCRNNTIPNSINSLEDILEMYTFY
jgi:HAD superfamily hydrolase (TIGR01549 family)